VIFCSKTSASILLTYVQSTPSIARRKLEGSHFFCTEESCFWIDGAFPDPVAKRVYSGANFTVSLAASFDEASSLGKAISLISAWKKLSRETSLKL